MKLKCENHGRRVLSLPNSSSFHHRTGDMSKCNSKYAILRDNTSRTTRKFVVMAHKHIPNLFSIGLIETNKE